MRHHHHQPPTNRLSPLSSLCLLLLILLSESCHSSSAADSKQTDWPSDFGEVHDGGALKRASSYVRFGKRSESLANEQDVDDAQHSVPEFARRSPVGSMERSSRASSYVRFGKRGGPLSRSHMTSRLHEVDDAESGGGGRLLPSFRPRPCTLSYLSTLASFGEKYAHIQRCAAARDSNYPSGLRRATRGREASYVRYG